MEAEKAKVLIVDDEPNSLEGLREIISQEGFDVSAYLTAEEGVKHFKKNVVDLVLTDLNLPGIDGMEFSRLIMKEYSGTQIIIVTAYGTVKGAVEAMKEGVFNYVTKPINIDELLVLMNKALDRRHLELELSDLKTKNSAKYKFSNIIGQSGPMIEIYEKVLKISRSNSTVLLRGESGTGKELIAHAIHQNSNRADMPFVEINCSAFPDTLLESELFGYEKGAFTGAYKQKLGRFESAHTGTIFLDEIGDINPSVQVKLLRVLQEKTYTRLGSTKNEKIDVRVIAATNANLESALKEGLFREDLYYRLNVIPLTLPPLRKRKSDIPLLIEHFLKKYSKENEKVVTSLSGEAQSILVNHHWQGNVRELENAVENSVVMCDGEIIQADDLPPYLLTMREKVSSVELPDEEHDYQKQLEMSEHQILLKALDKTNNNKTKAAELLGISLRTMRYKVKKYNL